MSYCAPPPPPKKKKNKKKPQSSIKYCYIIFPQDASIPDFLLEDVPELPEEFGAKPTEADEPKPKHRELHSKSSLEEKRLRMKRKRSGIMKSHIYFNAHMCHHFEQGPRVSSVHSICILEYKYVCLEQWPWGTGSQL